MDNRGVRKKGGLWWWVSVMSKLWTTEMLEEGWSLVVGKCNE